MYLRFGKRLVDVLVALLGLLLLWPLLLALTLLLAVANGGKPFFSQRRPGRHERIFTLYKFKTMTDRRDAHGYLLPDAERLTPLGRLVRRTSLDELPQLWNVLVGDMSLVGPRPLLVGYLPLYNERQRLRHRVRPGITGWAQVNGRNTVSWPRKFEYDVWYVENLSASLDLKILFLTVGKVLRREGINAATSATVEPFRGNGV
ncbi:sugar transferase [Rhabdobacter roseus]|uniref:Lipopolysaccharide/colanic/teichoic acid biosynthesis glycosyltransferase n=1 Tax=Rhabdobacter roseus TaxID=1655419 RepID=A0A840TYA1_9BACT|nr:sugar transferase [Rhabdobacter roseus]MBB5284860.1 lipopolysaccharide/colanic/teichoic acid biosynthesis glycosyltransferase [Rhabdobacter roseus]